MKAYKAEFYFFFKSQPVDQILRVHACLETRRNGLCLKEKTTAHFHNIQTRNYGLRIISTYYKKKLVIEQYEMKMFLDYLYSNVNYFLDNEVTKNLKMFLSHFFLYAHIDIEGCTSCFGIYSEFVCNLYKFCYGNLKTDLFEVGVQVLEILLDISRGE